MAVASAISQARGGAPIPRATPMMVAAFCRCASLRSAAVVRARPPAQPATSRTPVSHGPDAPAPPPPPRW